MPICLEGDVCSRTTSGTEDLLVSQRKPLLDDQTCFEPVVTKWCQT